MAMTINREDLFGTEKAGKKSYEAIAAKMALDVEAEIFLRMKERNLKQKDVAELLGVTPAAVSKLLSNSTNLTLKTIARFAEVLDCTVEPIRLSPVVDAKHAALRENP